MDSLIHYLGVVPAEWFDMLNETQKLVFLTQTGTVVLFGLIIIWLLVSPRGRVPGMKDRIPKELWTDVCDAVHDVIFDKWLVPDKITPKQYKEVCRFLEPKIPGLVGKLYTPAARKIMRVRSQKFNAAQRILEMQNAKTSGFQLFTRKVAEMMVHPVNRSDDKFKAAKKLL